MFIINENDVKYPNVLFPRNYLEVVYLDNVDLRKKQIDNFFNLISNKKTKERDVLNFINRGYYFLIASIVKHYYFFGHHDAYIFPEFKLGTKYVVDYLVIGKNSDGFHFLLFELESVYKSITTLTGLEGTVLRKGISQTDDWKTWIEGNFFTFQQELMKYINPSSSLPNEFLNYDSTRFNYSVIAGRRADYKTDKIRKKQREYSGKGLRILHYDNIIDRSLDWISGEINRWVKEE